jgi:hypothetical protein
MYVPATCPFKGTGKGNSPTGGSTHEQHRHHHHRHPIHPKPQTTAATATPDGQRDDCGQCERAYCAVRGRAQRCADRLPRRYEPLPQLQLWQCVGDCTAETDRYPRGRNVRMEPAWTPREERRERHPHSRSHHRHSSARKTRKPRRTSRNRTRRYWLASAMPTSSM